jgi:hypothetical protein
MLGCEHNFFETNYNTHVCYSCGLEREAAICLEKGYTTNVPLLNCYSRHQRMYMLLNQLFNPRHYGCPNSEVVANILKHGPFSHGTKLLDWLAKLKVKHKQYQNAHYYFAIASSSYVIPDPPPLEIVQNIERSFNKLVQGFRARNHKYKSFFSYNWLLRKFLEKAQLNYYIQFVKKIKCKKRMQMYETMWGFFTKPPPHLEGNAATKLGVFRSSQKQLGEPPLNDSQHRLGEQLFLDLLARTHHCSLAAVT